MNIRLHDNQHTKQRQQPTHAIRYKGTAAVLRTGGDAAPVELPGRMVVVDCEEASRKLLQVSGDLRKGVLQRVESTLGKLASKSPPMSVAALGQIGVFLCRSSMPQVSDALNVVSCRLRSTFPSPKLARLGHTLFGSFIACESGYRCAEENRHPTPRSSSRTGLGLHPTKISSSRKV